MELIMLNTQKATSMANHVVNTVIMWLFCLTVLMLIVPWQIISPSFAKQVEANKIFIYFALVIEISNFITQGIITLVSAINHKNYAKRLKKGVVTAVESLDFAERALLREFVLQRKSVLTLPLSEPTVRNLVDNCVLRIVDTVDEKTHKVEVIISKEARPYITYKAIGLTLGKMTEEQISQIMNARPEYAKEKMMQPNRVVVGAQSVNQLYRNKKESSEAAA